MARLWQVMLIDAPLAASVNRLSMTTAGFIDTWSVVVTQAVIELPDTDTDTQE